MSPSPITIGVGNDARPRALLLTAAQGEPPPAQRQPPGPGQAEFVICDQTIEVFHKVLKSGCRAEEARLRSAERLVKLIAVFCILSWRVFWMTMINRAAPDARPELGLTKVETVLLDRLLPDKSGRSPGGKTLSSYLIKIARLGGYLARASDPPPGNIVIWRGLTRLTDIKLGATLSNPRHSCG